MNPYVKLLFLSLLNKLKLKTFKSVITMINKIGIDYNKIFERIHKGSSPT